MQRKEKSIKNCGLVDARISASDKDLPVLSELSLTPVVAKVIVGFFISNNLSNLVAYLSSKHL